MLINFLQKNKLFRKIIYETGKTRANGMIQNIESFFRKDDEILDIGSGACNICEILSKKYKITPLDVRNLSFIDNIKPILYDGNRIPFNDNKFDVALVLTVLHHTPCPEKILEEAKRVSKRIVVIEDIYSNWFHKCLTYFFDSLLNLEFIGHPHANKSDRQWKETFEKLYLKLVNVKYSYSLLVFKHAIYFLEK